MKKFFSFIFLLALTVLSTNAYELDFDTSSFDTLGDDITNSVNESLEPMLTDIDNWQDDFEDFMLNFEINLQSSLDEMNFRIDSMMDGIMSDLDDQIMDLENELEKISEELPNRVVNNLDNRLDVFFDKLDDRMGNDTEKVIESLTKLTDKVSELENSGRFKKQSLLDMLSYIDFKTNIEKNITLQGEAENLKSKDVDDINKEELEIIKKLFDSLN